MARFAGWAVLGVGVLWGTDAQISLRPSGRPAMPVPAAQPGTQPPSSGWTLHSPSPEWTFKPPCEPNATCRLSGFSLAQDGYVYGTSVQPRQGSSDLYDYYLHRVSRDGRERWNVSRFIGHWASDHDWVLAAGGMSIITTCDPWSGGPANVDYQAVDADGKFRWAKNWTQFVVSEWDRPVVCPGGDLYLQTERSGGVGVVSATTGQVHVSTFGAGLGGGPGFYCGPDDSVFIYVWSTVTESKLLIRAHANLTEMWRVELGHNSSWQDVATLGPDGTFYGIDPVDMTIFAVDISGKFKWTHKWTQPLPDFFHFETLNLLVGTNGTLYVVSGKVVNFLGQNGELLWSLLERVPILKSIVLSNGGVLYSTRPECAADGICNVTAKAVSPEGQITWEHSFDDDRSFVAGGDNSIYAFNPKVLSRFTNDGTLQWNFTDGTFVESVSVDKGSVYVTTTSQVYAFRDSPTLVSTWV